MEKLIKRGSEADIFLGKYYGKSSISKIRKERKYRQPILDKRLRKRRTINEARMLIEVKNLSVLTPIVYYLDISKSEIIMQYMKGKRVKELLLEDGEHMDKCIEIGKNIGNLHQGGIIHGDLTVSNFIKYQNKIAIIDFGLSIKSQRTEDFAMDLHILNQTLNNYYTDKSIKFFEWILLGYEEICGAPHLTKVLKRINELEKRGRYGKIR